eukprot:20816-Heterococcus_DN1.PRE.2
MPDNCSQVVHKLMLQGEQCNWVLAVVDAQCACRICSATIAVVARRLRQRSKSLKCGAGAVTPASSACRRSESSVAASAKKSQCA